MLISFSLILLFKEITGWQIVENTARTTNISGVLLPRYTVQIMANETLTPTDKDKIFRQWGEVTVTKAVSEGRGTINEVIKDVSCYPGPPTDNSKDLFPCNHLIRANETVNEAKEFFNQLSSSNESMVNLPPAIAKEFSRHLSNVRQLNERLPEATREFKTDLQIAASMGDDLLSEIPISSMDSLNQKIFKAGGLPLAYPPLPKKNCRWNSTDLRFFLNKTGVSTNFMDEIQKEASNENLEDELCGNFSDNRNVLSAPHNRTFTFCDRQFWQKDFANSSIFKKIQSLFGDGALSLIESFVGYARNRTMTDSNFTQNCEKLLNNSKLRGIMDKLTRGGNGGFNLASLMKNFGGNEGGLMPIAAAGGMLNGIKNGGGSILSTLMGSSPTSNSAAPSSISSAKENILNNIGPRVPEIGKFLVNKFG